jgi:hypothetical protein
VPTQNIDAPVVEGLITNLHTLNAQHAILVANLQTAVSEEAQAELDLANLSTQIAARYTELSSSGDTITAGAFDEETQAALVQKKKTTYLALIAYCKDQVAASQAQIEALKSQLDSAWLQFAEGAYRDVVAQYRQAMIGARDLYAQMIAWRLSFHAIGDDGFPPLGSVVVQDPLAHELQGGDLFCSSSMMDMAFWTSTTKTTFAAVQVIQSEIEQAKAGGTA